MILTSPLGSMAMAQLLISWASLAGRQNSRPISNTTSMLGMDWSAFMEASITQIPKGKRTFRK